MASVIGTHYNKTRISTSCTHQVCVLLYAKNYNEQCCYSDSVNMWTQLLRARLNIITYSQYVPLKSWYTIYTILWKRWFWPGFIFILV